MDRKLQIGCDKLKKIYWYLIGIAIIIAIAVFVFYGWKEAVGVLLAALFGVGTKSKIKNK